MKHNYLLLIIPLVCFSCYTTSEVHVFEPNNPAQSFLEEGKQFIYNETDRIIVSVGFDEHTDDYCVLDLSIDNQSDSAIEFNPSNIYVFCYSSDSTLLTEQIYQPLEPDDAIIRFNEKIFVHEDKIKRNNIFRVILGLIFWTTEAVILESKEPLSPLAFGAAAVGHEIAQISIDESSAASATKIDDLHFRRDYFSRTILRESMIAPGEIKRGKVLLTIPFAHQYIVYIPVKNGIQRFAFTKF